jgi:hypothetical protein
LERIQRHPWTNPEYAQRGKIAMKREFTGLCGQKVESGKEDIGIVTQGRIEVEKSSIP